MKKLLNHYMGLWMYFLMIGMLGSCSEEEIPGNMQNVSTKKEPYYVTVSLSDEKDADSRMVLYQADKGLKSVWVEGDDFTLINQQDNVAYTFHLSEGEGTSLGRFVCYEGEPVQHADERWRLFYPASITSQEDYDAKISLLGQVQKGDGNMDHLNERLSMRHLIRHYSDIRLGNKNYQTTFVNPETGGRLTGSTTASNLRKNVIVKIDVSNLPIDMQPVSLDLEVFNSNKVTFRSANNTYVSGNRAWAKATMELQDFDKDKDLVAYMAQSYKDMVFPAGSRLRLTVTDISGENYYSEKYFEVDDTIPGKSLFTLKYSDGWKRGTNYNYRSKDFSDDGLVVQLQKASVDNGINVVFMGDGFSDRQVSDGLYHEVMMQGYEAFFLEEPYKSFKHLFNIYYVVAVSEQEGCIVQIYPNRTAFKTCFGRESHVEGDNEIVRQYSYKVKELADVLDDFVTSVVMINSSNDAGTCFMFLPQNTYSSAQGYSVAYFPAMEGFEEMSEVLNHEANGHGFGKLADEYVRESVNSWIDPSLYQDSYGWYMNVDVQSDPSLTLWSEFYTGDYITKEGIGAYLGAYAVPEIGGYYRPTYNSIMRYNTDGFNAPSRKAIYVRMHKLVYGEEWTWEDHKDEFLAWDAMFGMPDQPTAATSSAAPGAYVTNAGSDENEIITIVEPFVPLAPPVIIEKKP